MAGKESRRALRGRIANAARVPGIVSRGAGCGGRPKPGSSMELGSLRRRNLACCMRDLDMAAILGIGLSLLYATLTKKTRARAFLKGVRNLGGALEGAHRRFTLGIVTLRLCTARQTRAARRPEPAPSRPRQENRARIRGCDSSQPPRALSYKLHGEAGGRLVTCASRRRGQSLETRFPDPRATLSMRITGADQRTTTMELPS